MIVPRAVDIELVERLHEVPNWHVRGVVLDETVWFGDGLLIDDDGFLLHGRGTDIRKCRQGARNDGSTSTKCTSTQRHEALLFQSGTLLHSPTRLVVGFGRRIPYTAEKL